MYADHIGGLRSYGENLYFTPNHVISEMIIGIVVYYVICYGELKL